MGSPKKDHTMNLDAITTSVEAAVEAQLQFASDPAVREAGSALVAALGPALREAGLQIARQAAEEVRAQLGDRTVDVVLDGDDPIIRIGDDPAAGKEVDPSELDARITLRLPAHLKELVEQAADIGGDSVNTWVVKTLSGKAKTRQSGSTITGSYDL